MMPSSPPDAEFAEGESSSAAAPGCSGAAADVELLRGLVAIPSTSGNEEAAVSYLVEQMAARGLRAWVDAAGSAVTTPASRPAVSSTPRWRTPSRSMRPSAT